MSAANSQSKTIPIQPHAPSPLLAQDASYYLRSGLLQLKQLPPLSLYIHIPWCLKKCPYCDFNSHAKTYATHDAQDALEQAYIQALLADLDSSLPLIWGRPVISIFFGGGTPSLFSPKAIGQIISHIRARLPLQPNCEITLEANPSTFEYERFYAFSQAGVTRLSVGVQSFDDACLQSIGRVHNAAQACAALEEAAQVFSSFNVDLMYALPKQTLAMLQKDILQALSFEPPHISIYHLTIEPNTWFAKHPPALPDEDVAWDMLDAIDATTTAQGFSRYEVSAYCRLGHHCVHNQNYWEFGDYLGIGAGAHSKLSFAHRIVRQVRYRDPNRYIEQASSHHALTQAYEVAHTDLAFEYMLCALRLRNGFAINDFTQRTGLTVSNIEHALEAAEAKGWIQRDLHRVRPTQQGFDFLSDLQALFLPA